MNFRPPPMNVRAMSPIHSIRSGVAIHGGVGTLPRADLTPALDASYRETLTESLYAGHEVLDAGGSAVDAVVASVSVLEDSPLFNAGRGSNFDERGIVTMDASIMDGQTLAAGAVAGVTDVRNPVELSRLVMDESEHVLLIGEGAEAFARSQGIASTERSFFHTDRRWAELEQAREHNDERPNVLSAARTSNEGAASTPDRPDPTEWAGTVGAVALDREGRIAAATSTGGMANKTWGRVGDSPVIGAGTYAGDLCAVSCTGWGEYFITHAVAYDVHARMEYAGRLLTEAAADVIRGKLEAQVPGAGGLVAIDRDGNIEMCFSTEGMYRGWVDEEGRTTTAIFEED
jgi:beta-aspartyl-peptidase (threonine type)